VRRNAYGRQLGSFHTEGGYEDVGTVPMTFIRAPGIVSSAPGVRVMARVDGAAVAVEYGRQMAMAFHPELDPDRRLHRRFVNMI
ncbi:MAG TPA: pyridoxal 5'-phosphate synthase glutaminase subunit PdxT, partial [Desulfovibrio sp.]|nr:pyridoxal 5'-phosphate synthase glutaminase subunit PdxT [Desulfovibrio sp.]